jgi:hypothetical protein
MASEKKYYVKDSQDRIAGPFAREQLIAAAKEGRILPSWGISSTQTKWTPAAQVPDLFAPMVRCGVLAVDMAGQMLRLLTTNPVAPETFRRTLPKLDNMIP